jgi:hypothetical protein
LVGSNQISKQELQTYQNGMMRGYNRVGKLLLKCPAALNAHNEINKDGITIRPKDSRNDSKEIVLTPDGAEGWDSLVYSELDLALPVNEGANVTNFNLSTRRGPGEVPMYDPYTAREVFGNINDPASVDERWMEYDLTWKLYQIAEGIAIQRATGIAAEEGARPIEKLLEESGGLPPFVGETIGEFGGPAMTPPTSMDGGQLERTAALTAREGRGQQMSDLAGVNGAV